MTREQIQAVGRRYYMTHREEITRQKRKHYRENREEILRRKKLQAWRRAGIL